MTLYSLKIDSLAKLFEQSLNDNAMNICIIITIHNYNLNIYLVEGRMIHDYLFNYDINSITLN